MQSIKNLKSYFEQVLIISLLLFLMASFISLGFYVVEKSMYDLMGIYENPSVVYISQTEYLETTIDSNINQQKQFADVEAISNQEQLTTNAVDSNNPAGINNLAIVLDSKIEKKAQSGIIWTIDKLAFGLEFIADLLSKALQA
ncbi:hypothetical protein [Desulfuribacillus alkaliarsenatis]|uniref:Uncharacterized protein n=1 Tax=Desulfuribacillus alkaliarsenatis TaxID=766136 RepID=A0A1E5G0A1_9FIRM|nr:hypothetical protein [Desulfuribacillus alkaliarsenatis]OEF96244.1 hypothetical protein BHF68_08760 [Desulfuribacillus alkaliarsenatis]